MLRRSPSLLPPFVMERLINELLRQATVLAPQVGMGVLLFVLFWLASLAVRQLFLRLSRPADFNTALVLKLAGRTASIAVLIFGTVTALGTMGINVSALVAGLGLTGFALGFALKDVVSNSIAGVLILLYRPFTVNDYITVGGQEGIVTEIDLRYTTLERDDQRLLIPNSVLFTNSIVVTESKRRLPTERAVPDPTRIAKASGYERR
ncbi:mechanosensitive ion channel family protein [Candidatus Nitrospira bockiana]